ncbi:hypothetical protein NHX12_005151, partial [Muraenolepis orangiensis]
EVVLLLVGSGSAPGGKWFCSWYWFCSWWEVVLLLVGSGSAPGGKWFCSWWEVVLLLVGSGSAPGGKWFCSWWEVVLLLSSSPGCVTTDASCVKMGSPSCGHRGRCHGELGSVSCQCMAGFTGQQCEEDVPEYSFDGRGHVHYHLVTPIAARRTWVQVLVRTRKHSSAILSLISKDQSEYLRLEQHLTNPTDTHLAVSGLVPHHHVSPVISKAALQ